MRRAVVFLVVSALAAGHGHAEPPVHRWLVQAGEFSDDLSANQRRNIEQMLSRNQLHGSQSLASLQDSMFGLDWPLLASTNFTGFDYHGVSNFVDHDLRFPGFLQDYTCGTRTYDNANGYNHAGSHEFARSNKTVVRSVPLQRCA